MKRKIRLLGKRRPVSKERNTLSLVSCEPSEPRQAKWQVHWEEHKFAVIVVAIALAALLTTIICYGQVRRQSSPVKPGHPVPDLLLTEILNDTSDTLRLSNYRDKLLILDFWSTVCGTCVEEMPEVAALQKSYTSKINIIYVDFETAMRVGQFYARRPELKNLGIPVATSDTLLRKLFPHRFEPHVVWIDHGICLGATGGEYLNNINIASIISGSKDVLREKHDLAEADTSRPFFFNSMRKELSTQAPVYSCSFTGFVKGLLPREGTVRDSITGGERSYFTNIPILDLYAFALSSGLPLQRNKRLLLVSDTGNYVPTSGEYHDIWAEKHSYTFETTTPVGADTRAQLKQVMETCLAIKGNVEQLETSCLILIPGNRALSRFPKRQIQLEPAKPAFLHHIDISDLLRLLNTVPGMPPVVSDAPSTLVLDLDLPFYPLGTAQWKKALKETGITLEPGKRVMDMFVLRESNLKKP